MNEKFSQSQTNKKSLHHGSFGLLSAEFSADARRLSDFNASQAVMHKTFAHRKKVRFKCIWSWKIALCKKWSIAVCSAIKKTWKIANALRAFLTVEWFWHFSWFNEKTAPTNNACPLSQNWSELEAPLIILRLPLILVKLCGGLYCWFTHDSR